VAGRGERKVEGKERRNWEGTVQYRSNRVDRKQGQGFNRSTGQDPGKRETSDVCVRA
jgi:hypothetical protein